MVIFGILNLSPLNKKIYNKPIVVAVVAKDIWKRNTVKVGPCIGPDSSRNQEPIAVNQLVPVDSP